jgi:hypothetical protein
VSTQYQVVWPYATVKLIDSATGQPTFRGFNEGSILPPTADPADVKRLVGKGAVADLDAPASVAEPEPEPNPEPELGYEPEPEPGAVVRPKDYGSKAEWVDYAVSQRSEGVSEEDARAVAELSSKAELIAEFGN